jgi:HSP20 family protein
MLTISSEKEEKKEEKDEKFTRKEYNYSSFTRSFSIPEDVKQDEIDASYESGVLNIRLPKMETNKRSGLSKAISVK